MFIYFFHARAAGPKDRNHPVDFWDFGYFIDIEHWVQKIQNNPEQRRRYGSACSWQKKQIRFEEIVSASLRRSKAISISGRKCKIYIDPAVTGYEQIFSVLSDKGFI